MYARNVNIILITSATAIYLVSDLVLGLYLMSSVGLAFTGYIFLRFFQDLGKRVEIRDIISLTATMQWILGPVMAYNIFPEHPVFYMAVDEKAYMDFVVPACIALFTGLYFPLGGSFTINNSHFEKIRLFAGEYKNLAYKLIASGLAFNAARTVVPGSLEFLFFLLGNLQFVGLFLLMLTPGARFKWQTFALLLVLLIGSSVLQGMFHQLLLWLIFMFLMMALVFRFSFFVKAPIFIVGLILVMIIQSVKDDYREQTWYKTEIANSRQDIFKDVFLQRIENPSMLFEEEMTNNMNARLNQGWIIARIMNHVPDTEPYANGETVLKAIEASLVPRILNPSKTTAGGHKNFERFTGTPLNKKTSMDLSLAGEAYANYGSAGGMIYLLLIGLFYNLTLITVISLAKKHPVLILFIPLLFFQVIKAETDLATVLNHLVKASVLVFIVFTFFHNILKIKI